MIFRAPNLSSSNPTRGKAKVDARRNKENARETWARSQPNSLTMSSKKTLNVLGITTIIPRARPNQAVRRLMDLVRKRLADITFTFEQYRNVRYCYHR